MYTVTYQDRRGRDFAASPVAVTSVQAYLRNREIGHRSRGHRTTTKMKVVSAKKKKIQNVNKLKLNIK